MIFRTCVKWVPALLAGSVIGLASAKLPPPPPDDPEKAAAAKAKAAEAAKQSAALLEKYVDRAVANYKKNAGNAAAKPADNK